MKIDSHIRGLPTRTRNPIILGVDPALTHTGWVIIQDDHLIESGTITTTSGEATIIERIHKLCHNLRCVIAYPMKYRFDYIFIEQPFSTGKLQGEVKQHLACGAIIEALVGIAPAAFINNKSWKKHIGITKYNKKDIVSYINNMGYAVRTSHEADAVGVALFGRYEYIKNKNNIENA